MKIKFKIGRVQFEIFFAWYDIWIGTYIDLRNKTVYIILVPMFPLKICGRNMWTSIDGFTPDLLILEEIMVKMDEIEYTPIKDSVYGIVAFRRDDTGEEIEEDDPRFPELLKKYEKENE